MTLREKCPTCGKVAEVASELHLRNLYLATYKCGHSHIKLGVKAEDYSDFVSEDGKKLLPYQITGARFAETSDIRCLIADEMGLGKTVQALAVLKKHKDAVTPCLIIVKSALCLQWLKELMRWTGLIGQVIQSAEEFIIPGMPVYIISVDLLRRIATSKRNGGETLTQKLGIKCVILDECQAIKNTAAQRTKEVRRLCRDVQHVIALSGSPINNHAGEYYSILNILKPTKFPTEAQYLMRWCDTYWDGFRQKTGGISNPQAFKNYTSDFIIRRTREEVLPELPNITRNFQFCDLGETVQKAYDEVLQQYSEYYYGETDDSAFVRESNILAYLAKMRYLTGIAKVDPIVEYVTDFITETERKIVIFVHHHDVATMIYNKLAARAAEWTAEWGPGILNLTADLTMEKRQEVVENFWGKYRVMVASTLAAGEGLNLQCASDVIIGERQWNPAKEEQAEARVIRIGQQANKITGTYPVAVGTIDEYLAELVERKRGYVASTLDAKEYKWDESSIMKELAELLAQKGAQKWQK